MQRKRGELVPVAEAFAGLPGPVQALRPARPARWGFTRFDQVDQLVSASEADPDRGFLARTMALCSLPRSNPGDRHQYKRVNGPFTLYMFAGRDKLPFGNLPRLLLAWVCTEAVRTQSRELVLGKSLSDFMRSLGVYSSSGGRGGVQTRLRNQMKRLFGCSVSLTYTDADRETSANAVIADLTDFWWDRSDGSTRWKSKIRLSESFFQEIIRHPVPLDMNTLTALKRSPLGLDLYLWLTYRTFALRAPQRLTWRQVYRQFGVDPEKSNEHRTVQDFRRKVLRELGKIKLAWPELNYGTARGLLILYPSTPLIPPADHQLLAR